MENYEEQLRAKLTAARKRVRQGREVQALKSSAPTLFEIIDGEITLEINRGYGEKPLSYDEYIDSHGAVRGIKRIRNLLDSKEAESVPATQEVKAIEDTLKQIKNDKKQQ